MKSMLSRPLAAVALLACCAAANAADAQAPVPLLFVTQVPTAAFQNVGAAFGAHQSTMQQAPRGGDLWIRYPDGTLRNLTQEAGFGIAAAAQDGANAIAVRQPTVHWRAKKAIFSMLVGAPSRQYQVTDFKWQLYEVTGLGRGETAQITKVACQPADYNNIAPAYASDGQILFTSDRPRNGSPLLYPQRDEYESAPVESGLWKLDTAACTYRLLEHAPSGITYPMVDSFGRVIFTKWDHLQRDQQADHDVFEGETYGTFDYDSETQAQPPAMHKRVETFPELRQFAYSKLPGQGFDGKTAAPDYPFSSHIWNHFFPWMLNQDGSGEETLNHVGRHELGGNYTDGSFRADPALTYLQPGQFNHATFFLTGDGGMFQLREDPLVPGRYYGVRSPEFGTQTAGDIVRVDGAPGVNPESMQVTAVATKGATLGLMRNPLPRIDGTLVVSQTSTTDGLRNTGTDTRPAYNYAFRLRTLDATGAKPALGAFLTNGLQKSVAYWDPDQRVTWSGALWELDPAEVRVRRAPPLRVQPPLPRPEARVLQRAGVDPDLLRNWLHQRNLALLVSRDVTRRDRAELQQPFNLRVAGGPKQTVSDAGATLYDVTHLQFFQGDQLRGYASGGTPQAGGQVTPGRRVLAEPMHDRAAIAAMGRSATRAIQGAVPVARDGSMAAFVPAGRAMTWQLVDDAKTGWDRAVVRERNWLSFKPGETRVCASCHGVNVADQAGDPESTSPPKALGYLLKNWTAVVRNHCAATGGTGAWSYDGIGFSAWEDGRRYRIQSCQGGNGCCDGLPATETQTQ